MIRKIAILGVAHYHANFWTQAFLKSEGVAVPGAWDSDPARLDAFTRQHGIAAVADLPTLLSRSDAVAICSETAAHPALVRAAADKELPILCEKPLGATREQCDAIAGIVAETGVRFMQSFPKRFDPVNHEIAALLRDGAIGRVTLARIRHGHSHGFDPNFRRAWFVDPALSGGGTLLDEGVHAADFLRWMFGDPVSASATISSGTFGLPVEDTAAAIFRFADGMIADVTTSWAFAAADTSIEIYGTDGTILLGGVDIASRPTRERDFLRIFRREQNGGRWVSSPTVPHFKTGVFHEHVAWAFVRALEDGSAMPVTLEDGRRAFAIIDAAYRSARSGRVEPVAI